MTRVRLQIERLGHRGDGIASGPVYVPGALPGEEVEGDVSNGRMERPKFLSFSAHRRAAPCDHYGTCGGCALMHAADDFVADWKTGVVREALAGQRLDAPVRAHHTSPSRSRRRAVLAGKRTRSCAIVGFHERASGQLIDLKDCVVMESPLTALLPTVRAMVAIGGTRKAEMTIMLTQTESGADVAASGGKTLQPELFAALARIASVAGIARLSWDGEVIATLCPPTQLFGSVTVEPPPGAFMQATRAGEAVLVTGVLEAVGSARRIADLFCGMGTFTFPLATSSEILAVDSSDPMIRALTQATRRASGLRRVTAERRDLFRRPLALEELTPFDAAVIDPPRAGAEDQVRAIASSTLNRLAYVSCNPVSFARDARILSEGGFALHWIDVVDQFRWSTHVELVASFSR